MNTGIARYFAYGSNMDPSMLLQSGVRFYSREASGLEGYALVFNKATGRESEGYANIVPEQDSFVQGILYSVPETDLQKLDRYEGVPLHYRREEVSVFICHDKMTSYHASVYVVAPGQTCDGLKPSKEYMQLLLNASDLLWPEYSEFLERIETLD